MHFFYTINHDMNRIEYIRVKNKEKSHDIRDGRTPSRMNSFKCVHVYVKKNWQNFDHLHQFTWKPIQFIQVEKQTYACSSNNNKNRRKKNIHVIGVSHMFMRILFRKFYYYYYCKHLQRDVARMEKCKNRTIGVQRRKKRLPFNFFLSSIIRSARLIPIRSPMGINTSFHGSYYVNKIHHCINVSAIAHDLRPSFFYLLSFYTRS